ncbi:MAG TPA: thiamine pyrophosphate-binding protein [Pseudonocardia sp.]|jgi:thiamine pyrophosphate-dependent acetolactate synthase large subunit-like protein
MHVHQALARALHDNGVRHLFGVLGDANLHVVNDFGELPGSCYVAVASEGGAVLAALGYAQVSGRLGVATATHGPGLTNTITGLVEAERARVPLLLIAGDTPASAHDHIQDIDQRPLALAAGARFVPVRSGASAVSDLATAIRAARTERIPVVLNLPIDLLGEQVEYRPVNAEATAAEAPEPEAAAVEDAVGVIASAKRPLVLAGRGVATSGAAARVSELAARIGAPVATTLRGKDLFAGHRHNLGIFGSLSDEFATEVISRADCVVALGCGLNPWTTAEGALLRGKGVVHVDTDPGRLNRFTPATVSVAGDASAAASAFIRLLDAAEVAPTRFADEVSSRLASRPPPRVTDRGTDTSVDIRTALRRIDEAVPANRVVVTDNGRFILTAFTALHVEHPRLYAHAVNFGAIGLGMSTALGASYAEPDRPVLAAIGDGGFALGGLSDLVTAVMQRRRIVIALLNDGAYGAEYVQLRNRGMDPSVAVLPWPDFGPIARAIGAQGHTVHNLKELDAALEEIDFEAGPVLLDVRLDPDHV